MKFKSKNLLELDHLNKILKEIDYSPVGLRDRAMIGIFYGSHLRPMEGIEIQIDDFDLNNSVLYVRRSKRTIELSEKVRIWIKDYMNYGRPQLLLGKENNTNNSLFITQRGNTASYLTLNRRIKYLQNKTNDKAIIKKRLSLSSLTNSKSFHLLHEK